MDEISNNHTGIQQFSANKTDYQYVVLKELSKLSKALKSIIFVNKASVMFPHSSVKIYFS